MFLHFRSFIVTVSFALELAFHWATHDGSRGITRYINILHTVEVCLDWTWIGSIDIYEIEEHRHMQAELYFDEIEKMLKKKGCSESEFPTRPEHLKRKE